MKTYYIWIGTFEECDFEEYWDNEIYENEMELWKKGQRDKPSEDLKCGFCREMGLEEFDKKDFLKIINYNDTTKHIRFGVLNC